LNIDKTFGVEIQEYRDFGLYKKWRKGGWWRGNPSLPPRRGFGFKNLVLQKTSLFSSIFYIGGLKYRFTEFPERNATVS